MSAAWRGRVRAGRIQLIAAGPADSTVEIGPADPSKSRDVKLAEQITAGYSDGVLRVTAPAGNRMFGSSGAVDAEHRTARGDIRVTEAAGGTVVLRTQTGGITVSAAAGVSATLDAGTTVGRIHNALKNTGVPGLTIQATTTVGDITADSR